MSATRRNNPEEQLQETVCQYLDWALAGNSWYTAIPLGGGGEARGRRLKRTGTKPGTPDVLVTNDGRAIWFELKSRHGTLSTIQHFQHEQIRRSRCPVYTCKTLDEVIAGLRESGVPLRAEHITTERIKRGFANVMDAAE